MSDRTVTRAPRTVIAADSTPVSAPPRTPRAKAEPTFRGATDPRAAARFLGRAKNVDAPTEADTGKGARDLLVLRTRGRSHRHSDSQTVTDRQGDAPAIDLPDPPAAYRDRKDGPLKKQQFTGPVFNGRPKMNDVNQQELGDCYVLAPLAACAATNPKIIEEMLKDNGDGTFDVRLFVDGKERIETVDRDLYVDEEGKPVYCRGDEPSTPDEMVMWAALIEKAFAQFKKTYGKLGRGGDEADTLKQITGKDTTTRTVGKQSIEDLYDLVRDALDKKLPVCCSTPEGDNDDDEFKKLTNGLVLGHVYSIIDAKIGDNGVRYLRLRNPWGSDEVGKDDKDDGCFWIPLRTLQTEYEYKDSDGKRQTSTWMEEITTLKS